MDDNTIGDGAPEASTASVVFDEEYYRHDCGVPYERNQHWLDFFGKIAANIVSELAPVRVLDVGCAMGFLVEALRNLGVEAWGIDVSEYAISQVDESAKPFCALSSATEDLPDGFPEEYDLVTCIEVVEHLPSESAAQAVSNLTRWGRRVLFSSSSDDYSEPTHFNVQPGEDWSASFARCGFLRDFDVDVSFLTPWSVLYERRPLAVPAVVKRYERRFSRYQRENIDLRSGIGRLQRRMAELDRSREDASALQAVADRELELAKTEMREANDRTERASSETDALRAQVTETTAEIERLRTALAEMQHQASELHSHYQAAIHARDAAQTALTAASLKEESEATQAAATSLALEELRARAEELDEQLRSLVDAETERYELQRVRAQLAAVRESTTWRIGRLVVGPLHRVRSAVGSRQPRNT